MIRLLEKWFIRESMNIAQDLDYYTSYYVLRDRLPLIASGLYVLRDKAENLTQTISALILSLTIIALPAFIIMKVIGGPTTTLTGFTWRWAAPIQYSTQILTIWYMTRNLPIQHSIALAVTGAVATGYVYEFPFWFFTEKTGTMLIHTNPNYVFLVSGQMLAIPAFLLLLRRAGVIFAPRMFYAFTLVQMVTILFAKMMYIWETAWMARVPMILLSFMLVKEVDT